MRKRGGPYQSRCNVTKLLILLLCLAVGVAVIDVRRSTSEPASHPTENGSPFVPWDGVWEGEFTVYRSDGEAITRLNVHQEYRHVEDGDHFRQEATFREENTATGETETKQAVNTAALDGSWLRCEVFEANKGDSVTHEGRLGDGMIFWHRSASGVYETFREWVNGDVYYIEGFGIYGDRATAEPLMFVGRYRHARPSGDNSLAGSADPEIGSR